MLPHSTDPSAIHISADGKIVKAWPSSREDAEAYAQTRGVSFEPFGIGDVISPEKRKHDSDEDGDGDEELEVATTGSTPGGGSLVEVPKKKKAKV